MTKNSSWIKMAARCVFSLVLLFSSESVFASETDTDETFRPSQIIVSMGDSYSSGEGITPFLGQKNASGFDKSVEERLADPNWIAHRSTKSWGGQLKLPGVPGTMNEYRDSNWYFVAVSGATTEDFYGSQKKPYAKISLMENFSRMAAEDLQNMKNTLQNGFQAELTFENFDVLRMYKGDAADLLMPQLDILRQLRKQGKHVDYVTLTLGGNDLGFVDIVEQVILNNDINEYMGLADMLALDKVQLLKGEKIYQALYNVYSDIASLVDEDTAIIVAGYPHLFSENINPLLRVSILEGAFGYFTITKEEAEEVNKAIDLFNETIESIVDELASREDNPVNIHFVDVTEAFNGHEAYSENPFLRDVVFVSRFQDIQSLSITSAYSIHPNENGARAYANCVQKKINELEAVKRYLYALRQLTRDGTWYEGVTDDVRYILNFGTLVEQNDCYDVEIRGYDPDSPTSFTASGEGYLYNGADDSDFMYDITYDGDDTTWYSYYYYDDWYDKYMHEDGDDSYITSENSFPPDFYNLECVTDEFFSDITHIDEFSFTGKLTEEQYSALGLDVASTLEWWMTNDEDDIRSDSPSLGELFASNDIEGILDFYQDEEKVLDYILYGGFGTSDRYAFKPVSTESVTFTVKFNQDMTFDSITFNTSGTVEGYSETGNTELLKLERDRCFRLSDLPTDAYYSLVNGSASTDDDDDTYDYEDILEELLDSLGY